jgi:arylsulfatase A-like enzyme
MKRINNVAFVIPAMIVACFSLAGCQNTDKSPIKPNIILIVSDDQGYADLSCIGTPGVSTPNLDNLAANGVRLTNWYASSPICAPSRIGIMTGRYPIFAGMNVNVKTGKHNTGLPKETATIAEALKKLDYHTSIFGKWHLGAREDCWPVRRGFDYWYGMKGGCVDFYSHILYYEEPVGLPPIHDLYENGEEVWENGRYFTELITEKAITYFDGLARDNDNNPFFAFLAYTDPHYPMHAPETLVREFQDLPPERRIMAAKIKALDNSIGEILEAMKKNGQLENTLIFFMSDNGPSREIHCWLDETVVPYKGGETGRFRGHKQSLFEGGIRVPAIVSWPGKIPQNVVSHEVGIASDLFPTFLTTAGGNPDEYSLDGKNLLDMFTGTEQSPHDAVFWEFRGQYGVRKGRFKLVINGADVDGVSSEDKIHLADLESEEADMLNVKNKYPEITNELKMMADEWYENAKTYYKNTWEGKNADQRSYPPYIESLSYKVR